MTISSGSNSITKKGENLLAFLRHVLPPEDGRHFVHWWKNGVAHGQTSHRTHAELVREALAHDAQGHDSYFAVGSFARMATRKQVDSAGARSLWLDLDYGPNHKAPNPYPTLASALAAVKDWCDRTDLPLPTIVASGNGLHLYWVLERTIDRATWEHAAKGLAAACKLHGLHTDPERTRDIASVLRAPGTHNYKGASPAPVFAGALRSAVSNDHLLGLLAGFITNEQSSTAKSPERSPNRLTADQRKANAQWLVPDDALDGPPASAALAAQHCKWLHVVGSRARGNVAEPLWYAMLGVLGFAVDGDTLAHAWSDGHPGYSAEETTAKLEQVRARQTGPTTCAKLESLWPPGKTPPCASCPHKGQITSPLALGRIIAPVGLPLAGVLAGANGSGDPPDNSRKPKGPVLSADPSKPVIQIVAGNLATSATWGEQAVIAAGQAVFSRGPVLVRPIVGEVEAARGRRTKVAQLLDVDGAYMRDLLSRSARWTKWDGRAGKIVAADPPADIASIILARSGEWAFPPVIGVITTPTIRPDGSVLSVEGYDATTRLVLVEPPSMPVMVEHPTKQDAECALALLDGLLDEFPFVDEAGRSVALSALITPVVRGAFSVAPLHASTAPSAGTGKSFLFDISAAIAIGQPCPVLSAGKSEEETEKRLGAALIAGQPIINIDNLNGDLGGDAICQIVERPVVDIRVLGKSENVRIEARATVFATGNNLKLLGDMTRRVIVCSLDARAERPELRAFSHDPVGQVLADRGQYVAACLDVVRAYLLAGAPRVASPLASFEGWSKTVRSALLWLGRADPVATMEVARREDPQLQQAEAVFGALAEIGAVGFAKRVTVADLIRRTEERTSSGMGYAHPNLRDALMSVGAPRGLIDARFLGKWLSRYKGRIINRLRLDGITSSGHVIHWWVDQS